ncbi:Cytochrome c oxidase subunit 5A [Entomortierella beljakovae]|nr:Cytochrome c oxidase subunit 5A [Entomortierella beljakovae]
MIRIVARPTARFTQNRRAFTTTTISSVPLHNLETRWSTLSVQDQTSILRHLQQVQAGDWSKMSLEEKKAAFWISFGPYGSRRPLTGPYHGLKVFTGTVGVIGVAFVLFLWIRSKGGEKPITTRKEWQEASNEYARTNKINPITGVSSENYKGAGFVANSKN